MGNINSLYTLYYGVLGSEYAYHKSLHNNDPLTPISPIHYINYTKEPYDKCNNCHKVFDFHNNKYILTSYHHGLIDGIYCFSCIYLNKDISISLKRLQSISNLIYQDNKQLRCDKHYHCFTCGNLCYKEGEPEHRNWFIKYNNDISEICSGCIKLLRSFNP